jgi:hypothetical protein
MEDHSVDNDLVHDQETILTDPIENLQVHSLFLIQIGPYTPLAGPSRRSPPPNPSRSASPKVSRSRIAPMKSYKNFMLTQSDDASPDIFQRRYDEYQVQYCKDASNYYFEKNKCEEWFRERYDPLIQQNMETESQEWAQAESQKIFDRIAYDKAGFLSSARLSPLESTEGDDKSITGIALLFILFSMILIHFFLSI